MEQVAVAEVALFSRNQAQGRCAAGGFCHIAANSQHIRPLRRFFCLRTPSTTCIQTSGRVCVEDFVRKANLVRQSR